MKLFIKCSIALSLALVVATPANATNGMFMIGYGVKSVGMGGVAIAFPQDALAGATNPATIAEIGTRLDLEATAFLPNAQASLGGTNAKSRANQFLIPGLGFSMPVDNETTFGFSMIGAGGGGTHYKQNLYDIVLNGQTTNGDLGVDLMVMQMNPTIAQKLTPNQTVGFSLVMGLQRFKAFGLTNFDRFTSAGAGGSTDSLTNRGVEYSRGMGMRFGWLGKFPEIGLTLGAEATSKVYMTRFQNYAQLFAENGKIDTPGHVGVGMSLKATPKITLALDIMRTYYSKVNSIGNPGPNTPDQPGAFPISQAVNATGLEEGLGFGWRDQTVYKLGVNYEHNSKLTWRGGWNYGKSPINQDNGSILFNIVAPANTQNHATLGATYKFNKETEFSFAYMHAFAFSQSGPTFIGNSGTIKMSQNSFGAALGFYFY